MGRRRSTPGETATEREKQPERCRAGSHINRLWQPRRISRGTEQAHPEQLWRQFGRSEQSQRERLKKFKGIGEAKAISIIAALELGKRRRSADARERKTIASSKDAYDYMYAEVSDLNYEKFWVILLNRANKVIRSVEISEGGIAGTVADLRKIFRAALEASASAIILCHNHPSGQLQPSEADVKLTEKAKHSGQLIDIPVLDHLIFGGNSYYSFADEGNM